MADHLIPHFHNDPGVSTIRVRVKEFMCTGAKPPFDHPHIFIDMGGERKPCAPIVRPVSSMTRRSGACSPASANSQEAA